MADQVAEVFTEVIARAGLRRGRGGDPGRPRRTSGCWSSSRRRAVGWRSALIDGGMLVQPRDTVDAEHDRAASWRLVAGEPASPDVLADLEFAWRAVRAVKSNAILLAHDGASVGVGMGQVNRVDSCRLAVERAGDRAAGSVAASDAFFPFADGPEILLAAGVAAIVQPGGSVRDDEVIAAARAAGATDVPHRRPALLPLRLRTYERAMTAQILDGKALAATIKAELTERVAALAERGITPGLGTILVGDDPGQPLLRTGQAPRLRRGGHRLDPGGAAGRHQRRPAGGQDQRAERRPGLHRLSDPAAVARQSGRQLGARPGRPGQGRGRAAPDQPRPTGAGRAGAAAMHAPRRGRAAAPERHRAERRRGLCDRPWHDRRPPARAAADPQE